MGMTIRAHVGYGFVVPQHAEAPEGIDEDDWADDMQWHIEDAIDRRSWSETLHAVSVGDWQSGDDSCGTLVCVKGLGARIEWGNQADFAAHVSNTAIEALHDVALALGVAKDTRIGWVLAGYVG